MSYWDIYRYTIYIYKALLSLNRVALSHFQPYRAEGHKTTSCFYAFILEIVNIKLIKTILINSQNECQNGSWIK